VQVLLHCCTEAPAFATVLTGIPLPPSPRREGRRSTGSITGSAGGDDTVVSALFARLLPSPPSNGDEPSTSSRYENQPEEGLGNAGLASMVLASIGKGLDSAGKQGWAWLLTAEEEEQQKRLHALSALMGLRRVKVRSAAGLAMYWVMELELNSRQDARATWLEASADALSVLPPMSAFSNSLLEGQNGRQASGADASASGSDGEFEWGLGVAGVGKGRDGLKDGIVGSLVAILQLCGSAAMEQAVAANLPATLVQLLGASSDQRVMQGR
jgi:hypothetical protein